MDDLNSASSDSRCRSKISAARSTHFFWALRAHSGATPAPCGGAKNDGGAAFLKRSCCILSHDSDALRNVSNIWSFIAPLRSLELLTSVDQLAAKPWRRT